MESSSNNPAVVQSPLEDRDRPSSPSGLKRKHFRSATSTRGQAPSIRREPRISLPGEDEDPIYEGDDDEEMEVDAPKMAGRYQVSPKTKEFLVLAFVECTPNQVRHQWRDRFGYPEVDQLFPPTLDKVVKNRLHPATKSLDKNRALRERQHDPQQGEEKNALLFSGGHGG